MKRTVLILALCGLIPLFSCGEKDGPTIQITVEPTADLQAKTASDLVFLVTGNSSSYPFPVGCGGTFPAGCGVDLSSSHSLNLGLIPLGSFTFTIKASIRDSSGNTLYTGTATFTGDGSQTAVTVTVVPKV